MRKLAHIEKIEWKKPIDGADRIELVGVLGWQCIAKKDQFQVGDKCIYIEIDSIVDKNNPNFAFLESKNYKIKTMKMRGVISQGIVFPISINPSKRKINIGDDLTEILKITKVEDEIPKPITAPRLLMLKRTHKKLYNNKVFKWFMKFKWFNNLALAILVPVKRKPKSFPWWIQKTDETRLQTIPHVVEVFKDVPLIETEKLDGTSSTYGLRKIRKNKYEFVVCSRTVRQVNMEQKCYYEDMENVYWKMANKFKLEDVLKSLMQKFDKATTVVLQGETIGEGIQKNKYGIKGHDIYFFNLKIDGKLVDSSKAIDLLSEYGLKWVPILSTDFKMLSSVDEMIANADGKSMIADTLREGKVFRDHKNTISFKCISNAFLLKHDI